MEQKALSREELLGGNDFPITWEFYPTMSCNLKCTYCYLSIKNHPLMKVPKPAFSIQEAISFLKKYAKKYDTISFIGGEPFVRIKWMKEFIKATEKLGLNFNYFAYTNGTLLSKISPEFLNKFSTLSISIDGKEKFNDAGRGKGTYKKILTNLKEIKPHYKGGTIARMTIIRENNLAKSVKAVLPYFDLIYWQFENRADMLGFPTEKKWSEIKELLDLWFDNINRGKVLSLYPFIAITSRLLEKDRRGKLIYPPIYSIGCGAGYNYIQIFTTGDLYACPEQLLEKNSIMGNIKTRIVKRVELKDFPNTHKCPKCPEFEICHTRCLHWTPKEYCILIRRTIGVIRENFPKIKELIAKGKLKESEFAMKGLTKTYKQTKNKKSINYTGLELMF